MTKFYIQDWAGNVLDHKGFFKRPHLAVAMTFNSFDDAWGWIYDQLDKMSDDELDAELGQYDVLGAKGN